MTGLVVTGWSTLLVVLVGWRLPIRPTSLRRVSRRSLLLCLGLLLVALLLAVTCLLALVTRLLLTICCWLGVATLVISSWLTVSIVTARHNAQAENKETIKPDLLEFIRYFAVRSRVHTSEVQWEQPVDHNQGKQTELCTLVESHKTGRQLEQQQQEYCHSHWLHNPGLTVNRCE